MKVQFDIFCLVKIDILMDLDHRKSLCVKLSWGDMDEKEGGGELGLKKQKEEVKGVGQKRLPRISSCKQAGDWSQMRSKSSS